MDINNYLERLGSYYPISHGLVAYLGTIIKTDTFKRGTRISPTSDRISFYPLVIKGSVRLFSKDKNSNEEINLDFKFENEFLWSLSDVCLSSENEIIMEFLEDCNLMIIKEAHYHNISKLFPEAIELTLRFNSSHLRHFLNQLLIRNSFKAKDRYVRVLKEHPKIGTRISVKDMATFLGVDQKTLSRIRSEH